MRNIIADTSVVIKWYSQENDREKALKLLELRAARKINFIFPEEIILELLNGLHWGKNFKIRECKATIESFLSLNPRFITLQKQLILETIKIGYKYEIAAYDALFIAASKRYNIPLITADYQHHQKKFSAQIIWLSDWNEKL